MVGVFTVTNSRLMVVVVRVVGVFTVTNSRLMAVAPNFYIDDDLAASSSSRPQRLCDVCAEDRKATHSCLQCQQKYCLPCRISHDSFRSCYGHTVVSLTVEDDGCGKGAPLSEKPKVDLCPKHPNQQLLLYCTKCKVSLCLQCKLTQHEGHPTQDLADTSAEVKDKLKDRLGTLTQEMTEIDHIVTAVQDRCSKLQEQKRTTEAAFHVRADTLQQWVKQSLEEAVSSLQSSSEQWAKPWQEGAQQLGNRKQALQAQQDHILRVLKDGQEAELVSLEAQLSSGPEVYDVTLTQMEEELTRDMPTFAVEYNTTAVNPVQLRTFIGMLVPPQPERAGTPSLPTSVQGKPSAAVSAKGSDVTGTPSQPSSSSIQGKPSTAVSAKGSDVTGTSSLPTSVQGKPSAAVSAKRSDVTHGGDCPPPASDQVKVGMKNPPREFQYSAEKESYVVAMCLISQNRLWVMYRTPPTYSYCLKLFDAKGWVLTAVKNLNESHGLVAINDDIVLSWSIGDSSVRLVTPDGKVRTCDVGSEVGHIRSSATNDLHYLIKCDDNRLYCVKLVNQKQPGPAAPKSAVSRSKLSKTPAAEDQLTLSVTEVVFDETPSFGSFRHTSAGGRYFAFIDFEMTGRLNVYGRAGSRSSALISTYVPICYPTDARFCIIEGQEMVLLTVLHDNRVYIVDYTDGGRFKGCLDTGPLNLYRARRLATDNRHVWIGCEGGRVAVVDL
ncbi:hypothetical protein ACOMHN_057836 [Nucella lapillus]